MIDQFPVAEGLSGRSRESTGSIKQSAHFINETVEELGVIAIGDALSQDVAGHIEPDDRERRSRVGVDSGTERRKWTSTAEHNLQGPDHPSTIGTVHARRRHRVEFVQATMESDGVGIVFELRSYFRKLPGDFEIVGDRLKIETSSADEDRPVASGFDRLQYLSAISLKSRNGVIVISVDDVDQVMSDF